MTSDTLKILKKLADHPQGLTSQTLKKKSNLIERRFQSALQELLEKKQISKKATGLFRKQTTYILTATGKSFLETLIAPDFADVQSVFPAQSLMPDPSSLAEQVIEEAEFPDYEPITTPTQDEIDAVILGERINDIDFLENYLEQFTPWGASYAQALKMTRYTQFEERIQVLKKALWAIQKEDLGEELSQTIEAHNKLTDVPKIDFTILMAHSGKRVCKLIADSYNRLNQFTAAIEYYQKSLEYIKIIQEAKTGKEFKTLQGDILGAMAACYEKNEQLNDALEIYDKAISIFKDLGSKERQMRMLLGKGIVLYALKDWENAVKLYLETVQLTGDRTEQLVLLQRASEIPTARQNKKFLELLNRQKKQGEPEYKKAHFTRAEGKRAYREVIESRGSLFEKALWDFNIGVAELAVGRHKEAEEYYQKALKEFRDISDLKGEGICLYHLGILYQTTQNWGKAEKHLKDAVNVLLDLKSEVHVEDYRAALQADIVPVLSNLAITFLLQDKIEDAINSLEQGKSRELIRHLEGIKSSYCPKMEQLLDVEAEIAAEFQNTEAEMERLINQFTRGRMPEKEYKEAIKELKDKLTKTKAALQDARRTIYEKCVDPGLIPPAQDWTIVDNYLESFQGKQALVIEFLLEPKRELLVTFYCLGTEGKFHTLTKSLRNTGWQELLQKTREAIEFYNPQKLEQLAPQLYKLLFDQPALQAAIKTTTDLIIIPDSELYIVPWEILQPPNEVPLGISHAITRNFSLDLTTRLLKERERKEGEIALIGDPTKDLPGALQEVANIQKALEQHSMRLFLREKAQKNSVKEAILNAEIIHYAGHADFVTTDPSLSLLLLHDYPLTASEIATLRFNSNPLVFLSACESGVSRGIKGGEVVGLIRSLTLAGAQTIISTNWRVSDDSARDLAIAFYKSLLDGLHVSKALQKARKEIYTKYNQELSHWAAYTLYGDPFFEYS
ncbi:MAG: CHAT domain-containing protein [Candidatus Hodarchaeota archaeon]